MQFLLYRLAGKSFDDLIGEAELFGSFVSFKAVVARKQLIFNSHELEQLVQEPLVYLGDSVYLVYGNAAAQRFIYGEEALIVTLVNGGDDLLVSKLFHLRRDYAVKAYLSAANSLHYSLLESSADSHDFARSLHLSTEVALSVYKFIKRPLRQLYYNVVERRLEAGVSLARNGVLYLIEGVADSYLSRNLSDRIARSLRSKRRRARNSGVYFYYSILEAFGVECKLAVAAALYFQRVDYFQSGGAQHLVFLIRESNAGSDNDGVARVNAYGVEVFHRAYSDNVALRVAHYLKLYLFPARDALFYEHLSDRREVKAVARYLSQLFLIVYYTAAGTAEGECGANDERVAYTLLISEIYRVLYGIYYLRGYAGLTYGLHSVLKHLSVLSLVDSFGVCAEQLYVVLIEEARFCELHRKRKACLTAEG